MLFEGRVVMVTGAGSGIGRGFAIGFARDGAQVVGTGRHAQDLAQTAQSCAAGMHCLTADVSREADMERAFGETLQRFGRVDILVNNAAIYPKARFLTGSFHEWAEVIEINVLGMARCCHKALPGMLERGYGRIINVGSFAWKGPIPGASAYSVSKAAVPVLSKSIAVEIDRARYPDVLVNTLVPGSHRTRMSDKGPDPLDAYRHARHIASLPSGGPSGETFEGSQLWQEYRPGLRARLRRIVARLKPKRS